MILLTFSSILFIVRVVIFSISRRMPILDEARGISIVLMQVIIRCMIVNAERRFDRYEKSGSFLEYSWETALSLALSFRLVGPRMFDGFDHSRV